MYKRMNYEPAELRNQHTAWQVMVTRSLNCEAVCICAADYSYYTVCNLTHFINACQLSSYTVCTLKNFTSAFL